jgi:uncharacterized protein with NRDE domain
MCLIVCSWKQYEKYPLVLLANRDEFYERPAVPIHFWESDEKILAGKDLKAGGTWMGLSKSGRFAAITNYRDFSLEKSGAPSRGKLIPGFFRSGLSPMDYAQSICPAEAYNGFNLLLGTPNELVHYSNISNEPRQLAPGLYGLSNHLLDTPWPKVSRAKKLLATALEQGMFSSEELLPILRDSHYPPDEQLPDTGVGLDIERMLSPIFISSEKYGTRTSSFLRFESSGQIIFEETTHNVPGQQGGSKQFSFLHKKSGSED